MGYDLHVTRKMFWADADGPEISLEEWKNYVASDREVQQDPNNGPHDFLFVAHPEEAKPLWWASRGEVYTKNPDNLTVKKLIEIAGKLSAQVIGDDGEQYADWTKFPEPSPANASSKPSGFFRRIFGRYAAP